MATGEGAGVIELCLPYPPSANRLWVRAKRGMRRSDQYLKWLRDAGFVALAARPPSIIGKYKLSVNATRPDKRKRDIDNLIKPINDLLEHIGVVADDSDCDVVTARWVTAGEGVTVRIEPAGVE
jgi:crossover junction endodeoxyribonuclease RusA